MAAVNVTISGVLADKYNRTIMPVTLFGEMSYTGLGVGGGPIQPPSGGPPGNGGPVDPGYGYPEKPVDPGYGVPIGGAPHPEHPIVIPKPPTEPPPDGGDKPPPEGSGGWGFVSEWSRWGYFPNPATEAQPKG